jgi:hypothetical protein
MAPLIFPPWAPDLSSYKAQTTELVSNVVPQGDGYGPFPALLAFTQSLPGPCQGFFYARRSDGSILIFGATSTDLFLLNNTNFSWEKVSLGGTSYAPLSTDANWQFAQFGNIVFATQQNVLLQAFDITSATAFSNQTGSPPQAAYIAVVGQFLVLSGLLSNEFRLQWSGIGDPTNWVAGVNQSDFQDFPNGGIVRGVAGGEYGTVFQDTFIRSLVYQPGNPVVFQITTIASDMGLFAPYGIVMAGDTIYIPSTKGFQSLAPGALPAPIGKERVDRTFFANVDQANLQLCIGFSDPATTRVGWAYKSLAGQAGLFDTILIYDPDIGQGGSWSQVMVTGQYISSLSKPGVTLEGLDTIAPGQIAISNVTDVGGFCALTVASIARVSGPTPPDGAPTETQLQVNDLIAVSGVVGTGALPAAINVGNIEITAINGAGPFTLTTNIAFSGAYTSGGIIAGSLDAMTQSLDSFPAATLVALAAFNASNQLGFFDGPNLEATLNTAEQGGDFNRVSLKKGIRIDTDAPAVFCSVGARENLQNPMVFSTPTPINPLGICPSRVSTRYSTIQITIPAGTVWTFATAVEPMVGQEGLR